MMTDCKENICRRIEHNYRSLSNTFKERGKIVGKHCCKAHFCRTYFFGWPNFLCILMTSPPSNNLVNFWEKGFILGHNLSILTNISQIAVFTCFESLKCQCCKQDWVKHLMNLLKLQWHRNFEINLDSY